jgi:uncharacterized protein with beta-barrel porin domain
MGVSDKPSSRHSGARSLLALLLATTALFTAPALAQDANWLLNPGSASLSAPTNWSGGSVPTGTATFGASSTTTLINDNVLTLGGMHFAADAPAYTISRDDPSFLLLRRIELTGAGLSAAAGADYTLTLTGSASLEFRNSASSGSVGIHANGGLVYFRDTSTAGASRITVTGATAYFYDNSSAGTSTMTVNGAVEFHGSSTAANATINSMNNSLIWFRDNASAGSARITALDLVRLDQDSTLGNATVDLSGSTTFRNSSSAGSATITNRSTGWMEFQSSSTAGQANILNLGVLNFSGQASTGTATIDNRNYMSMSTSNAGAGRILNSGTLRVDDISGVGGLGQVTVDNTGLVSIFASAESGTIHNRSQGTLQFLSNSTGGSASIDNAGTAMFYQGSTAGSATITNSGLLLFMIDASTGSATISSSGRIQMLTTDTAGAGAVTLQSGGSLTGFGAVGNTIVASGATFAPSGGTMTVNGNLALNAGSTYAFTPGNTAAVSGMATLTGSRLTFQALSFADQTYTVLTHGSRIGEFALAGDGAVATALYGTNDVQLTVKGYRAGTALSGQGGANAQSVAGAIDRVIDATGTQPGSIPVSLLGITGANLAGQLGAMTGEAGTGAVATGMTNASTFLGLMLDPMAGARGAMADAPGSSLVEMADIASARTPAARVEAGWSIWTKAYGQAGRTASDAGLGAAGTAYSLYGVAAGADRLISPGLLIGFALAGGGTSFGLGTLGSGTGDFAQIGAYASMRLGPGYLSAALAYGWNRFDVTRNVLALGITETYRSGAVGHTFGGRVETGRRFTLGNPGFGPMAVTPYAAAEAIAYMAQAYRETWAAPATGAFALAYAGRATATLRGELGARADAVVASAASGDLIAFSRLAYAVQTNPQRAAGAQFQQVAGSGFTVFGARASTHTALATVGVEARFRQGMRANLALDAELGDRHRSLRGSVGLRQSW